MIDEQGMEGEEIRWFPPSSFIDDGSSGINSSEVSLSRSQPEPEALLT
jgi:hypothetical protein